MAHYLGREAGMAAAGIGITDVLLSPSRVYRHLYTRRTLHRLLWGFSAVALLHGVLSGMTAPPGGRAMIGALALVNTLGMALLTSLLGCLALSLAGGRHLTLNVVAPCVAYGFGLSLLVSWIPGSFWFAEPWKWGVIGSGFRELGGVSGARAWAAVLITVVCLVALFKWMLMLQGA